MIRSLLILVLLCSCYAARVEIPKHRIVGGTLADIKDFPYQASIQFSGVHGCGGSIISADRVLTAAHCLRGETVQNIKVRVGSSFHASGGSLHNVAEMRYHSLFGNGNDYDIAVLKVSPSFTFSDTVKVIPLLDSEVPEGTMAVVSGWGYLVEDGGANSDQLRQVSVPIIDRTLCNEEYYPDNVSPRMICAGYQNGGKDACSNDSGGPLAVNGKQIGFVSWGIGCGSVDSPGVYGSVPAYRDWIRTQAGV